MRAWTRRELRRTSRALESRGVSPESLALAAVFVSAAAGASLAAGGAAGDLRLWLLVPPLGAFRFVLHALLDCRSQSADREDPRHGER